MHLDNPFGLSEARIAPIADAAARCASAGRLLDWGREAPELFASPGVLTDVVVQDEFTHDIVVGLSNGLVLVFDST
jgi:hypothetical protein